MKFIIIAFLLGVATICCANAQTDVAPGETPTVHDRIKMERAKDAAAMTKDANAPRPGTETVVARDPGKRPFQCALNNRVGGATSGSASRSYRPSRIEAFGFRDAH